MDACGVTTTSEVAGFRKTDFPVVPAGRGSRLRILSHGRLRNPTARCSISFCRPIQELS